MSLSQTPSVPVTVEFLPGERPAVRSVELAQHFGLKHKNVLRDIDDLTRKLPESFHRLNFEPMSIPVEIGNGAVRNDRAYLLTRDAFTLLVMGWNSTRAMEWKLRYIEAFNSLERAALENARSEALADGARAALAVPPERLHRINQAVRYHQKGLNCIEIGKLLDVSRDVVWRLVRQARTLGLLPASGPTSGPAAASRAARGLAQ
ncbi:Rha family transcriptional regulator [Desulfolutivibrio sulfodismutans]|nr:Rha family transcriptional regulator [Desulfolutivibrio sulfodismutans]